MSTKPIPYYDSEGKPILSKSIVVVADILGYTNRMEQAHLDSETKEQEQLNRLHSILKEAHRYINAPGQAKWKVKIFSDNLIIGFPFIGGGKGVFELLQACCSIANYQRLLAAEAIFIRGGIAVGKIHIGDNLIFGHPLVEIKKADMPATPPRIILLDSATAQLESSISYQDNPLLNDIVWDDGNTKFINYLYPLSNFADSRFEQLVIDHKHIIASKLNHFNSSPGTSDVYEKYVWVANYHNDFCRKSSLYNNDAFMIQID